jgi:hypothetical protein
VQNHLRAFVELAVEAFELRGPVYDFGPCRGQERPLVAPWRPLFLGQQYISCGTRPGPGVDRLVEPTRLALPEGTARTVICVDLLQRIFEPQRAAEELARILAPGGVVLLNEPLDRHLDDEPCDYWRLTPSCLKRLLGSLDAVLVGWQGAERFPHTVFGIGFKAPLAANLAPGMNRFIEGYQRWVADAFHTTPWRQRLKAAAARWFADRSRPHTWRDFHQVRFSLEMPFDSNWKTGLLPSHGKFTIPARVDLS